MIPWGQSWAPNDTQRALAKYLLGCGADYLFTVKGNQPTLLSDIRLLLKKFGESHYETDDDRYWRWWEFAIFDDERWHTFHLDTSFRVSLESGPDSSRDQATSTKLLSLILSEFQACGSADT